MLDRNRRLTEEAGLTITVQEYADYVTPNQALSDGTNDANLFQHEPYLNLYNSESGDDLVAVGKVYLPPLALYSKTVDDIADLPDAARDYLQFVSDRLKVPITVIGTGPKREETLVAS